MIFKNVFYIFGGKQSFVGKSDISIFKELFILRLLALSNYIPLKLSILVILLACDCSNIYQFLTKTGMALGHLNRYNPWPRE